LSILAGQDGDGKKHPAGDEGAEEDSEGDNAPNYPHHGTTAAATVKPAMKPIAARKREIHLLYGLAARVRCRRTYSAWAAFNVTSSMFFTSVGSRADARGFAASAPLSDAQTAFRFTGSSFSVPLLQTCAIIKESHHLES
jgi:hypothetical protein